MISLLVACSGGPAPLLVARVAGQHYASDGWLVPAGTPVTLPSEVSHVTLAGVPEGCWPLTETAVDGPLTIGGAEDCRIVATDPRRDGDRDRPDVLIVTVDTMRADHVWASNALTEFSEANLVFTNARAPAPWTFPSTTAILSGRVLLERGTHNGILKPRDSLAQRFSDAGYRTAAYVGNLLLMANTGLEAGFDRYELVNGDALVIEKALAELEAPGGQPRFVYAHLIGGHLPYSDGSDVFDARDAGRRGEHDHEQDRIKGLYAKTVELHTVGLAELFDAAPVVVFTADHGEELWDHGGFEHGHAFWEELIHVPLVFKAPGLEAGTDTRPARLQDIAPTLAGLMELEAAPAWSGVDLRSADPGPLIAKHLILSGPQRGAVVDYPWKLIKGIDQLFDLSVNEHDPVEDAEVFARLSSLEPAPSDLRISPARLPGERAYHLRAGGEGHMTLKIRAKSDLTFAMDTPARVCGDVTPDDDLYGVTIEVDVSAVACELRFAPGNWDDELVVSATSEGSGVPVEWVKGTPKPLAAEGSLAIRVGDGEAALPDLSAVRALGYVE